VRTHWVLPNPTDRDFWPKGSGGRLPLWCITHPTLLQYLHRDILGEPAASIVEYRWAPADLPTLPRLGWERSDKPFAANLPARYRVEVILPSLPVGQVTEWISEGLRDPLNDQGPLLLPLDEDGEISRWIYANFPPRYALRQLTRQPGWSPRKLIEEPWLITNYSDSLERSQEAQDQALCDTLSTESFRRLSSAEDEMPEELADPNSLYHKQRRARQQAARH
jgi:hypothetical protein